MNVNNYRPISIVCTLSKMLEKVVYARLLGHLDPLNILSLLAMYCFSIFCDRGGSFILHAVILLNALPKMIDKYMKYTAFYTQLYIMLKSEVHWYGFFLLYGDGGMYSVPVPNAL